jgi:hypothetical protein
MKEPPFWYLILISLINSLFPLVLVLVVTYLTSIFHNLNLMWWYIAALLCYFARS